MLKLQQLLRIRIPCDVSVIRIVLVLVSVMEICVEAHTLSMFATNKTTFLFNFLLDHAVLHSFSSLVTLPYSDFV